MVNIGTVQTISRKWPLYRGFHFDRAGNNG